MSHGELAFLRTQVAELEALQLEYERRLEADVAKIERLTLELSLAQKAGQGHEVVVETTAQKLAVCEERVADLQSLVATQDKQLAAFAASVQTATAELAATRQELAHLAAELKFKNRRLEQIEKRAKGVNEELQTAETAFSLLLTIVKDARISGFLKFDDEWRLLAVLADQLAVLAADGRTVQHRFAANLGHTTEMLGARQPSGFRLLQAKGRKAIHTVSFSDKESPTIWRDTLILAGLFKINDKL